MSTSAQQVAGEHHVVISLRGTPEKIRIFHALVGKADLDYPWRPHKGGRMCTRCNGMVWHQPRLNPADLKSAARQVGGIKLKIRKFTHERVCAKVGESLYQIPVQWFQSEVIHKLYAPGGIAEVRQTLIDREERKPIVLLPEIANLPPTNPMVIDAEVEAVEEKSKVGDGTTHLTTEEMFGYMM